MDAPQPIPISRAVLRAAMSIDVDESAEAIRLWLFGGPEPDWASIGSSACWALRVVLQRGWLRLDPP